MKTTNTRTKPTNYTESDQALKLKLEKEKFEYQKKKDRKGSILGIIVGAPIFILIATFVIIWLVILFSAIGG